MAATVAELRGEIAEALAATSPTAGLDARLIVAHALAWSPNDVMLRGADVVGAEAAESAAALARRRATGEPVARIVGRKEFYGIEVELSPDTLVPRPDTETLVDAVLATRRHEDAVAILDLGTGSGAILLALLAELPNATGVGVDLSEGAVAAARGNAARLGLAERAAFAVGDWAAGIDRRFDVVVANPPYIESEAIAGLPVEVRDHDPHLALDGGADGLDAVRAILPDLDRVLAENGAAFVEIGFGQGPAVARLAAENRFVSTFRRDLAGIERVAEIGRRSVAAKPLG